MKVVIRFRPVLTFIIIFLYFDCILKSDKRKIDYISIAPMKFWIAWSVKYYLFCLSRVRFRPILN